MPKGEARRTMLVCIDSYQKSVPVGRFFSATDEDGEQFDSLTDLLIAMEKRLNESKFPQAFSTMRSFGEYTAESCRTDGGEKNRRGIVATFAIRVLFRQNASWQGEIKWTEGGYVESFRSVLELIFLMNSALSDDARSA